MPVGLDPKSLPQELSDLSEPSATVILLRLLSAVATRVATIFIEDHHAALGGGDSLARTLALVPLATLQLCCATCFSIEPCTRTHLCECSPDLMLAIDDASVAAHQERRRGVRRRA